jgi:hypothetical protein
MRATVLYGTGDVRVEDAPGATNPNKLLSHLSHLSHLSPPAPGLRRRVGQERDTALDLSPQLAMGRSSRAETSPCSCPRG